MCWSMRREGRQESIEVSFAGLHRDSRGGCSTSPSVLHRRVALACSRECGKKALQLFGLARVFFPTRPHPCRACRNIAVTHISRLRAGFRFRARWCTRGCGLITQGECRRVHGGRGVGLHSGVRAYDPSRTPLPLGGDARLSLCRAFVPPVVPRTVWVRGAPGRARGKSYSPAPWQPLR